MTIAKIDYVASWADRLESRFMEQYKGKPNLLALARDVCAPQFQDLEDAFQSLLVAPSIDDGEGAVLDVIGRIIGQLRLGVDDPTYRQYLRARDRANHSTGVPEDIYAVMRAMFGALVQMVYTPGQLASFELRIKDVITAAQAPIAAAFLRDATAAGVRGIFEWQEDVDANMFYTGLTAINLGAAGSGATILTVDTTAKWPVSGLFTMDYGTGAQETVSYNVVDGTTFNVLPLVFPHQIGSTCEYQGDPGLGFGDATNPATGGEFEGAVDVG